MDGSLKLHFSGDGIQCRQSSLGGLDNVSTPNPVEDLPRKQASESDQGSFKAPGSLFSLLNTYAAVRLPAKSLAETDGDRAPSPSVPPPPILIENDGILVEEWVVRRILDSRIRRNSNTGRFYLQYKVDWDGYDTSWEPIGNFLPACEQLVAQLHERMPKRPTLATLTRFEKRMRRKRTISKA